MSEEHVGRYSVMTMTAFETCSQVPVKKFQAVPSSGYRSYRNPSDLPFLLLFCKHLAVHTHSAAILIDDPMDDPQAPA